ncbi:hypothetical protein [Methylomagnum ishizawai]|uniref:hypothetical protein n=1 Tax=Methylomagnum ishizawai TaxID=1760988 RepID=UPI001C33EB7A|nr:hypothetical protein [Methylomagnum ishizawai]BBL74448.1 hypothetical protein MishRS11D_15460 [Methylomagnum ishizawai]
MSAKTPSAPVAPIIPSTQKPTPTAPEIQATISKLVSELFGVQSLLRLSHFTLETIASRDPARIEVDADDLARANAIALERLGVIVDLVDRVESAIDTFGPEPRQVSNKDTVGVGHE